MRSAPYIFSEHRLPAAAVAGIEAVLGVTGSSNWAKHNGNPAQCIGVSCSTTGKPKQ